ncbi:MAG: hypothetical protein ACJ76H_04415 [Bacteriovoracaceae bacterium]
MIKLPLKPSKGRIAFYLFLAAFILLTVDVQGHTIVFPRELAFLKNYLDPAKSWSRYWSLLIFLDVVLFLAHLYLWPLMNRYLRWISVPLLIVLTTLANYGALSLFVPHSRHITQFVFYRDLYKRDAKTGRFGMFVIENYSGAFEAIKRFVRPEDLDEVRRVMKADFEAERYVQPSKP